jgi:small subunit ribosomal protein S20
LANIASAKKRARQSEQRRQRNAALRTKMRTYIKKVRHAITGGDKSVAQDAFKEAVPVVDSMVTKGIIHKNTAARYKSRLSAQIKKMAA